ncbi:hypothetical protein NDU88_004863 [Pleurodeles waltl]|uniref:Uncharacterized protein n=1 Tax=Pleurodeles waltl TaxID=8319 RepID=A0AAV7WXW5_PLEWA|nr:hypothetical protein NDU88_004863 [Pleurodeles waltl]
MRPLELQRGRKCKACDSGEIVYGEGFGVRVLHLPQKPKEADIIPAALILEVSEFVLKVLQFLVSVGC